MGESGNRVKVDAYINEAKKWKEEFAKLRAIVLGCGLVEEMKWGVPCYTCQGKNIVLIHGFKSYCALLFIKGALLKDEAGILVRQTENVQAGRQVRFTTVKDIEALQVTLKAYIREAVEAEQSGLKIRVNKAVETAIPAELQEKFTALPELKSAFERLTPGRQRAYLLFFSAPKQSKTRASRIEKHLPHILAGKGLND
ncbi:MAG: DUF1801 domain-containing protein [Sporolactobacillus sp.]